MDSKFDFSELAQLINMNSYTKNKNGVDQLGQEYQAIFEQLGFSTRRYKRDHIGDHLYFQSSGAGKDKLLLLGHLDTVFPPNTFTDFSQDPHWIYGPGVCDMKGGNHVAITALRALKQQQGNITDIDVLLVSDEETGSDDSKYVTAQLAKNYAACLVFEAAGKNNEVVIGRKGVATFIIDIQGRAAHAGNHYSQGLNANLACAHMMIALTKLTNLALGSTVNPGKISGGLGANTISPKAQIIVEARFNQGKERDRLLSAIKDIVATEYVPGVSASASGGIQRDVMQPNNKQRQFLALLEKIIDRPLTTEIRGGVSDANVVSAQCVPTLDGFGPYGDGDHTVKERACKKSFALRVEQVSKILVGFHQDKAIQQKSITEQLGQNKPLNVERVNARQDNIPTIIPCARSAYR
jgi:glutamate carboxypeptidase